MSDRLGRAGHVLRFGCLARRNSLAEIHFQSNTVRVPDGRQQLVNERCECDHFSDRWSSKKRSEIIVFHSQYFIYRCKLTVDLELFLAAFDF